MSSRDVKRYVLKPSATARERVIAYEAELNSQQWQAVSHTRGAQLVIAGAGSGKTRTLIYRVAYLIEEGIPPERILLLTFTKKAAEEMMRRAAAMLDGRCARIVGGTFHGFANSVLRQYAERVGYPTSFSIADRSDAEDIVNIVRTELGLAKTDKRFPKKRTIINIISKALNTLRGIESIIAEDYPQYLDDTETIEQLALAYAAYKRRNAIMDYDDLLLKLHELLDQHTDIRQELSEKHQFIMVDEFQDTNYLQADIAHLLASTHENLLVVGDDAQSIYSFRGAHFRNIIEFPKRFERCLITRLEHNYRSTEPILAFCNAVMKPAPEKYEKALYSGIESTQKPVFVETRSFDEQSAFVAQRILELREEGVGLSDIAVLFRSGWHSNELEFELTARNIPFVKFGGLKFVEAAHVKDLVAIIRIAHNPLDAIAWHRLLLLYEGIGSKTAQGIIQRLVDEGISSLNPHHSKARYAAQLEPLYELLQPSTASNRLPKDITQAAIEVYEPLLKQNYDDFKKRTHDLRSFANLSERYTTLGSFLDELSLNPPETSQIGAEATDVEHEKLILSTIHSAKGLEWHSVFILSLIDGFIPSTQSLRTDDEIEEERRLLYVACTRAKKNLYMLCPQLVRRGGSLPFAQGLTFSERSRFLTQIPEFDALTEQWILTDS